MNNTAMIVLGILLLSPQTNVFSQVKDVHLYGFIHSLVVHEPPMPPVPNNETTTPYWVNDIVQSTPNSFSFTGQFGQLSSHVDQLPPADNIGFPGVASPWYSDKGETFGTSGINTILLTVANFIQWDLPINPDPSDPLERTVIENTETLFDWTNNELPNLRYYIYGNWPELNNAKAFPPTVPTQTEIDKFHSVTLGTTGTFNDWWTQYQDAFVTSRPQFKAKLIPVGRIISQIHTQIIPNKIPFDELYEDSDPHGRANTYFLAGLITYMALYEQQVPATYMPSTIIDPEIRNNLATINNFIWQELNNFNFPNGDSRVFYSDELSNDDIGNYKTPGIFPNPTDDSFVIESAPAESFTISIVNITGSVVKTFTKVRNADIIPVEDLSSGVYFVRIIGVHHNYIKKLIKK